MLIRNKVARSNIGRTRVIPAGISGTDLDIFSKAYLERIASVYPSNLFGLWLANDPSGRTYTNYSPTVATNVELCENTGFEIAGGGGADIWAGWLETAGTGAIVDEGVIVHSGTHAAKLTAGATLNTSIRPSDLGTASNETPVRPGSQITFSFWTCGDGANAGRYGIYDNTNGVFIKATASTGVAGIVYTQVTYSFIVPVGCHSINFNLLCPGVAAGIAYFDDVSVMATTFILHGTYTAAGVTYSQPGPIPALRSVYLDGVNTGITIGSKGITNKFNPNLGSQVAWGAVDSAARWTDAAMYRYIGVHFKAAVDTTKYITFGKTTTSHQLVWRRRCAVATYDKTYTFSPAGPLGWFCQGMTWDVVSTPKRITNYLYVPGILPWTIISDETPATGAEVWDLAIDPVTNSNTVAFAGTPSAQEWIGNAGLTACWGWVALSQADMKKVMVP